MPRDARPSSGGGLPLRFLRPRPRSAEEEAAFAAGARGRGRHSDDLDADAAALESSRTPLRAAAAGARLLEPVESSGPRAHFHTFGSEGGDVTLDVRPASAVTGGGHKGGGGRGGSGSGGGEARHSVSGSATSSGAAPSSRGSRPPDGPVDNSSATQRRALPSLPRALRQWGRVAKLWYLSEDWRRAWAWTLAAAALSGGGTAMMVRLSYVQAALMTGLAARDPAALLAAILRFAGIAALAAPLYAASDWVTARLALEWRAWLAGHLLRLYYARQGFYRLHGDGVPSAAAAAASTGGSPGPGPGHPTGGRWRWSERGGGGGGAAAAATATPPATPPTPSTPPPNNNVGADPGLVDNPDQRIADDASDFTTRSVDLAFGFVGKASMAAAFAGVLARTSPPLVGVAAAYALAGTAVTALVFGRRLAALEYLALAREGDFRFDLVRTREHSEAIAFFGGGRRERRTAAARLGAVLATRRLAVAWTAGLNLWVNAYTYAAMVIPVLVTAPRYFAGALPFGGLTQASQAFDHIESAINYFVTNLVSISRVAAQAARLEALAAALVATTSEGGGGAAGEEEEGGGGGGGGSAKGVLPSSLDPPLPSSSSLITRATDPSPSSGLTLRGLTVWTPGPTRRLLADGLDLALRPGQSLLVVGPSGCGKSALLRAVAGLWTGGAGAVVTPPARCTFFLPQKPFMPCGSLRAQLLYPGGEEGEEEEEGVEDGQQPRRRRRRPLLRRWWQAGDGRGGASAAGPPTGPAAAAAHHRRRRRSSAGADADGSLPPLSPTSDAALAALLAGVGLPDLATRFPGGLAARAEWAHVLSLGEQQRVSAARLLAARPALAFLDEATSALDAGAEDAVYGRIAAACPCYVSVGHHPALARFHTHVLERDGVAGEGRWVLMTAEAWIAGGRGGRAGVM